MPQNPRGSRAGSVGPNKGPQGHQPNHQDQHQGDGAEFLLREVDQDFFAQPGAQKANDHQERKVDEVVLVEVPVAPVDDGSGEVDDEVYERGSCNFSQQDQKNQSRQAQSDQDFLVDPILNHKSLVKLRDR